jgi:hypothetical protein
MRGRHFFCRDRHPTLDPLYLTATREGVSGTSLATAKLYRPTTILNGVDHAG